VDLPDALAVDLSSRVAAASYHLTTRTLNLRPERLPGGELPAWVERTLLAAAGEEGAPVRMAG